MVLAMRSLMMATLGEVVVSARPKTCGRRRAELHRGEVAVADDVVDDVDVLFEPLPCGEDGEFHLPSASKVKVEKLAARTPGSAVTRCSISMEERVLIASPAELSRVGDEGRFAVEAGVDIVEIDEAAEEEAAPTIRTSESDTWETMSACASRLLCRSCSKRACLQRVRELKPVARRAGMVPKINAVASVTARLKSSRRPLMETSRGMVAGPSETMRSRMRLATEARAMPSAPPAKASSRLSVSS